ncbi:LOW QUALITY PROTEIN: transcription initiation factor TFIID subunit 8-like [Asparagus officinalis]|uniref:LOW QUALITY PROTEIN: transcription initiation factor TFIID subunit 8-like n=1 Tax=Asparagus officinalis TaxID=4686 RepID=UPI00098E555D|nr:LOW QUALITY PROTEIN: transcription initiation factor TFIID subunit 8-like [Asparagus officinalis]
MSDGGKESARENSNSKKKVIPSGFDDFGRQIARIAVAQICEDAGFHSAHRSALDTLADIAIRFICELGKTSHFYANLSGRTSCNEFDIVQGLEDLGSSHGFASASDAHHCLVGSGVVREITQFVSLQEEVPFARSIPSFPVVRRSFGQPPSFVQIGEEPPKKHIPEWLPAFPDPHTYVHTPVWHERAADGRADKIEQARQRRKAERSLLSLQKRLSGNDTSGFVQTVESSNLDKGKQVVVHNPFLAPPLRAAGEKDIPEVVIPDEVGDQKRISVLETFESVIEAAKTGSFEDEAKEKRVLPKSRPTVHFKFGIEKKSVALPLSSKTSGVKNESWFLRDDEKDDKKRRAEMILKEAMENPHELTQL